MEILIRLIIEAIRAARRKREAALMAQSRPTQYTSAVKGRTPTVVKTAARQPAEPPPVRPGRRRQMPTGVVVAAPIRTPGPAPEVAPPVRVAAVVTHEKPTQGSIFRKALTPAALRRQIIVSELLQPPVALRE